jgi:hypothetical protein
MPGRLFLVRPLYRNRHLLGHDWRIMRNMSKIGQDQLEGVLTEFQDEG